MCLCLLDNVVTGASAAVVLEMDKWVRYILLNQARAGARLVS